MINMNRPCCLLHLFIILSTICYACSSAFLSSSSKENENDRMTLMALRDGFISSSIPSFESPLSSWNTSLHFCHWRGVICGKRHKRVTVINLVERKLDGILSTSIGNLSFLRELYLTNNSLRGEIPTEIGKLKRLQSLYLDGNSFQGRIPVEFSNCSDLLEMHLSHNNITGIIPLQFGTLRSLEWLDLSSNNLSGAIPTSLAEIRGLQHLNLSFNHLQGEVPLFQNLTEFSVVGNNGLCGASSITQLQPCLHWKNVVIAIIISFIGTLSLFVLVFILFFRYRIKYKNDDKKELTEGYQRVTYAELFKATEGFSDSNLIGTGNFGAVYRGILYGDEGRKIAVKVLNLSRRGAAKSFKTECKALRGIRHRNLLRIMTSCSSLDHKGNDFKALVFNFMSNGSLDNWLHFSDMDQQETRFLTLAKRLEISIDVGCALDYIHNCGVTPIVHCDLKPNNIILDEDMVAHVGDFGLAKMFHLVTENRSGGESLSMGIKGSIGYIAPEYGMGATISSQGDIYSYGIILLELMTGKRPTADMFNNEMSLRTFCERALPDHIHEVIDEGLVNEIHEASPSQRNPEDFKIQCYTFLTSFIEVGLSCSMESPRDRMDIQSCIKCLKRIKEKYDKLRQV